MQPLLFDELFPLNLSIYLTLAQIKSTLSPEKYAVFLKTFFAYNNEADYKAFVNSLFEIFNDKRWHFILHGMKRFVKAAHKESYERDVNQFILNHI